MRGSSFFDSVGQLDVEFRGQLMKVPIFYYDGTAATAVFLARYAELRRLLPDPRFVPARLAPGLGAVTVSAFEYRDTDIGPYNELAISVPLCEPSASVNLPGRALLTALRRRQFHAWVQHLPVTTEIARLGGVEFFNYPKFLASIDFTELAGRRTCRLAEDGEHILTLESKPLLALGPERIQLFSHLWMDGQPQSSEFKINTLEAGHTSRPGVVSLTLGEHHPIARELARLLVSRRAVHVQQLNRFEGILYGPDHHTLPLLARALRGATISEPTVVADGPASVRSHV
jgi:hypothetical protein